MESDGFAVKFCFCRSFCSVIGSFESLPT